MGLDIQSKEVIDKISQDLKVQPAMQIPRELMDKIQLVYQVNQDHVVQRVEGASNSSTGNATIFTTPSAKDFFLTSASMSVTCDVVADSTSYKLFVTINGVGKNLFELAKTTLVVFTDHIQMNFNPPLKLDRASIIGINQSFTVGDSTQVGVITGYEVDPQ